MTDVTLPLMLSLWTVHAPFVWVMQVPVPLAPLLQAQSTSAPAGTGTPVASITRTVTIASQRFFGRGMLS